MNRWSRRALGGLLALVVCWLPAQAVRGQAAARTGPRALDYAELGRLVRSLKGKVVVVYFWSFG